MATLEIRKKTVSVWTHISTDFPQNILSKLYCKSDGDYFRYVEISGRQRARFHYSNITVYDDSQGGGAETFTSALHLMLRLEDLEYPAFDFGSSGGIGFQPTIVNPQNGQTLIYHNGQWINVYPKLDDKILQFGTITIDENEVTLGGTWIWRISGITYSNLAPFVQNVPFASAGLRRTDIFVANQGNTFTYIQGIEAENAVRPEIPDNTLLATSINVYPDGVGIGDNGLGLFNRVVDIPFSEFGDDWANVTKENVAEKINDLEITQAQNEVHYFVVDDSILPPPVEYNFDVEFEDITDANGYDFSDIDDVINYFEEVLNLIDFVIDDFTITDNRLQCNIFINDDLEHWYVDFSFMGITKINDFSFLSGIYGIDNVISLTDNLISEISGLDNLIGLSSLYIDNNSITEISGLDYLVNMHYLTLQNNSITEISGLDNLINLQALYLHQNNISEISGLDNLINLQELYLPQNNISEISGLDNLINLQRLALHQNNISEISGLDNLINLYGLDLQNNSITEISGLDNLINLNGLRLDNNSITEISGLDNLINLELLYLHQNNISEISGLDNLMSLNHLRINDNSITTSGWDSGLYWSDNVAVNNGTIYESGNTDPITGTDFETSLIAKGWTIIT